MKSDVSRRERQILDVLYQRGRATAAEVQEAIPDAPSYSAIRALLRILEENGHAVHEQDGARYVYLPATSVEKARKSALRHMVDTFFHGNVEAAVAALLDGKSSRLTNEELDRLSQMIQSARKGTRK